MILKDSFYKVNSIEHVDDTTYIVKVVLLAQHHIYDGHFPGKPVVPGVCTLTIIKECLSEILQKEVTLRTIKDCKYISALLPQGNLNIALHLKLTDDTKLSASVVNEETQQTVLKLRAGI